jgi:competence protein ComEC
VDEYLNTLHYYEKVKKVVRNFSREQKQQVFSDDIIFNDKNICIKVLWPTKKYKETNNDFNDNSMVLLITLLDSNKKVILMADAGIKAEKEIMNKYPDLKNVEIIKIGHHGNSSSSSQVFIDKMNPRIVINSTGPHILTLGTINLHTSSKVMKAWRRANNGNTKIYTTYEHGNIVFKYNPEDKSFLVK